MAGIVTVEADTLQEAIERVNDDDNIGIPSGDYIDSSFEVSFDDPDLIRELYNKNQHDESREEDMASMETAADKMRNKQLNYDVGHDVVQRAGIKDKAEEPLLPVNRVILIRERYSEHEIWPDDFWVDANKSPSKELFLEAVEAFLMTKDGEKAVAQTCNDFNWGDAVIYVPNKIWNDFGIYRMDYRLSPEEMGLAPTSSANLTRIQVDQDEVLITDDYFDRLDAVEDNKRSLNEQIQSAATRAATSSSIFPETVKEPETEI